MSYSYLKETAKQLRDEFNSDVPKTIDELCRLRGVGPKMAFLTLPMAWNMYVNRLLNLKPLTISHIRNVGIGVDVHVDCITNRLGWHTPSTLDQPEKTRCLCCLFFFLFFYLNQDRLNLQSWLPKELWYDINHKLVGFGQVS